MAARNVRKNINLFVDGRGYAGQIQEFNPPKLTLVTEEFRAGGMSAPIEISMGMEKLESDFSLISYDSDVLSMFGVSEGQNISFVAREALESFDGTITTVIHTMRGKIKSIDAGTSKAGEIASLKVAMALNYYKLQHGDKEVQEIDVQNMIQSINGTDVLAGMRSALGI